MQQLSYRRSFTADSRGTEHATTHDRVHARCPAGQARFSALLRKCHVGALSKLSAHTLIISISRYLTLPATCRYFAKIAENHSVLWRRFAESTRATSLSNEGWVAKFHLRCCAKVQQRTNKHFPLTGLVTKSGKFPRNFKFPAKTTWSAARICQ